VTRALCALLLLSALSWPALADDGKAPTAILLVARAQLRDPNFGDSVVVVLNNVGAAPVGLVVNRPTRVSVSHLFPGLDRLARLDDKVYFGGPVQPGTVTFLFRADAAPDDATRVVDGVYASTDAKLLRMLLARDKPMEGLRIFVGYSGWGPGQLENEIARGDWTLAPVDADALFGHRHEHPWPAPQGAEEAQRT
jgi:putative transcriptional regulator